MVVRALLAVKDALDLGFYRRSAAFFAVWALQVLCIARLLFGTAATFAFDQRGVLTILLGFATSAVWVHLLDLWCGRRRGARIALNVLIPVFFFLLVEFHVVTMSSLDFDLIRDNFREIAFNPALEGVLGLLFNPLTLAPVLGWLLLAAPLEKRFRLLSRTVAPARPRASRLLYAVLTVAGLLAPIPTFDEFTYLLQSAFSLLRTRASFDPATLPAGELPDYPYAVRKERRSIPPAELPHVVMLFQESLNQRYLERRAPNGKWYTPTLNELIPHSLFPERFYANGNQTAHGWVATLCSILPGYRGKIMSAYPELRLRCLPQVLAEAGYRTVFMSALPTLEFEHTGEFMRRIGFQETYAMERDSLTEEERRAVWGWGLQDDAFYRRAFALLHPAAAPADPRPVFLVLANASNHFWFDKLPRSEWVMAPEAKFINEAYTNTLHFADRCLGEFLRRIDDLSSPAGTVTIIVGDHGYPTGEHGYDYPEMGFHEEIYRTAFLVRWPGRLPPRRLPSEEVYSQLDVAPTLLDLLGIQSDHHFQGVSLLAPGAGRDRTAVQIMPYDGKYIGLVRYPYKFVHHMRFNRDILFHLGRDPDEVWNLLDSPEAERVLPDFQRTLRAVFSHQYLLDHNRIWPAGGLPPPAASP